VLQRALLEWGIECHLAAPSLIPRRPGDRRKTDHRDAIKLGQDFRDGRLTLIHIPTEEEERVRDVVRCRETFQREIVKSRHYILKFMRRRGFIYREGTPWTTRHLNWIRHVLIPRTLADEDRMVLTEYLALLEYKLQRRDELDRRIEQLALLPRFQPIIQRLGCFRGFKTQAACHYRKRPAISASFRKRQVGQDADVIQHAWKCQHRLYKVFHRLALKKPNQVAATAVARELVGLLWAALRDLDLNHITDGRMNQAA